LLFISSGHETLFSPEAYFGGMVKIPVTGKEQVILFDLLENPLDPLSLTQIPSTKGDLQFMQQNVVNPTMSLQHYLP
jgi:hypothetical protein